VCPKRGDWGQNLAWGNEKSGLCSRSAVEGQWYAVFQRSITAANLDVCHIGDASQTGMGRKTEFSGLGLHRMRMGVQPFIIGESIDEMKRHYEQQRDKEFASHVCAEHPRATKNPR
jgi:hypothetical protein